MQLDFEHWTGDHQIVAFQILEDDGDVVDLTGASAMWFMAPELGMAPFIEKAGTIPVPQTDGNVNVAIEPEDTIDLEAGAYAHWLVLTDSSGNVSTARTGYVWLRRAGAEPTG